jgi:adenylyl cyclase-associated protein
LRLIYPLDDCVKTAVVFENIVACFEVVNCNSIEVQAIGKVPSFAVDKTSGCQIYLSKESLEAEIVTSKSSEMNVSFPDNSGELTESPIPEQYKSQVKNGKLVTEIVQHV